MNKIAGIFLSLCFFALPRNSHASDLSHRLAALAPEIPLDVIHLALQSTECATKLGRHPSRYLGIIDYSRPSTENRFWGFDTTAAQLLWRELVAHGKNSGENFASDFSNDEGSLKSSLGLYRTGAAYIGSNGYSLRLYGLETGVNDNAFDRTIVMHGAPYVSTEFINEHGRLGRSWGCPAVRPEIAKEVIDILKGDAFLYIYHPSHKLPSRGTNIEQCDTL
ncbi:MAG: murein L,D-transpeptidase catalytic domain family protein [Bdellovibrionales bacterium]|nr:murein L,D-transpeptidase catalytic domain family protein [Bdellovibrionales bacterium]